MKNAIAKRTQNTLTVIAPGKEMDVGARINYFHRMSKEAGEIAIKAALEVGMMLFKEKVVRGGTFQGWVEANCDFSLRTAYNYLNLLQRSIGAQNDLAQLSNETDKKRETVINEFSQTVESKTLTELMCDYGIITKSKSNLGGRREGAGRKRKEVTDAASAAAAADAPEFAVEDTAKAAAELYRAGVTANGFAAMQAGVLEKILILIDDISEKGHAELKAKKAVK